MPAPTSISPAPLVRVISKPTTFLPFNNARDLGSATVSITFATWFRRIMRPSKSTISKLANSADDLTLASVRMG